MEADLDPVSHGKAVRRGGAVVIDLEVRDIPHGSSGDIADLLRDPRNGGRVVMAFSRSIFSSFMIHQEPVIPR